MDGRWRFDLVKKFKLVMIMDLMLLFLFSEHLYLCLSLSSEGLALLRIRERVGKDPFGALSSWNDNEGGVDPCSWFGVECSDGKVVILNLKDLCLGGTLAPEIGKLTNIKSIILRNNSFYGEIPKEIGELDELEILDLGYNNFTGPFPSDLGNSFSLITLLLDNNVFIGTISPELYELKLISEHLVDENQLTSVATKLSNVKKGAYQRRLLADAKNPPSLKGNEYNEIDLFPPTPSQSPSSSASPSPSPSLLIPFLPFSNSPFPSPLSSPSSSPSPSVPDIFLTPLLSPTLAPTPSLRVPRNPHFKVPTLPRSHRFPVLSPASSPSKVIKLKDHMVPIVAGIIGGSLFVLIVSVCIVVIRSSKVVTVKPWASGLSGQLQKALVTGVPKLGRSELEAACEDFSNIIGSFSDSTVYKGTLSSGVEIAVLSSAMTCRDDWSKNKEEMFIMKVETLSRVNHKNFVNLIGYCEEEEPFTRMMVFEYAPNGTLFEHLHIREAEHLDWGMRLRIAMGMAYCLEHMHQLNPPIFHRNLQSSSIYLTEDYAAKLSDFNIWTEVKEPKTESSGCELLESQTANSENSIQVFGLILFEIVTGKLPYSVDNGLVEDWALDYLNGKQSLTEIVDPTLSNSLKEDELENLFQVIKLCIDLHLKRPTMTEITAKLREITRIDPDGATPKLSPLWWAELEIMSPG